MAASPTQAQIKAAQVLLKVNDRLGRESDPSVSALARRQSAFVTVTKAPRAQPAR
jgi:hypothetical protein